jgi:3-phenylpropionate/trans-cinnamate dioxygenase ferredoxin reductase subunit
MNKPVLIVGASMGGLRAAEAVREFGYLGPITAIGEEVYGPYTRPPLSKDVLAHEVNLEAVAFTLRPSTRDVKWILGTRAQSADLERQTVTDSNGDIHPYSALIIATGLRSKRLQVPNGALAGRHALRTLDDAIALRADLKPGSHIVILGAGFIACEVAATASQLGCKVTIVSKDVQPIIRPLGLELATEIQRRHEAQGVTFHMKSTITDLIGKTKVEGVLLDDGTTVECDFLVEAIGSNENTEWLEGNDIDISSGVLTDNAMRAMKLDGTAWSTVFAVGDVARFANPIFDEVARSFEHWEFPTETANRVGQVLAPMLTGDEKYPGVLDETFAPIPTFWSDQYDMDILAFGLPGIADEVKLLHGEVHGDCVFGYYRQGKMIGVCGIGLRSQVQRYRSIVAGLSPQ